MNRVAGNYGYLWVASEICYYLGLVLAALFIPTLALILWMMSLVDKADPNYWYLLITWVLSALLFVVGVIIKNRIYSAEKIQKES
jgi:hypothetical protein